MNKKILELKGQAKGLLDQAKALAGDGTRALGEEEAKSFNQYIDEHDKLMAEARNLERLVNAEMGGETREAVEADPDGYSEFRDFGEFLAATKWDPHDERLMARPIDARKGESRALQMSVGAAGGFLVPATFSDEILKVNPQDAIIRPRATVIPAGDNPDASISIPALDQSGARGVYSGVTVNWIGEGADKPEVEPSFREITLIPKEVAAYIPVTDKLLRNATAAGALVMRLLRQAIIASEDDNFMQGPGGARPTGFVGHPASINTARTGPGAIVYQDIVNMYASFMSGGRAVWIASRSTLPQLMTMQDAAGNLIWQPNARDGAPGTLMGFPVLLNDRSPVLGNQGDLCLVDLNYMLIKDGFGIAVVASEHPRFTRNQTIIKAFMNVDSSPWLNSPLLLEDGNTQVSPFVVLQ